MYFSKISFDAFNHADDMVQRVKQPLFEEHQMIWGFFLGDREADRDFLYRREDNAKVPFFYILSHRKPISDNPLYIIQSQHYSPKIQNGNRLQFNLRANAVKSNFVNIDNTKRKIRRDIVRAKKQSYPPQECPPLEHIRYEAGFEWLSAQGAKLGFELNSLAVENHQIHRFVKNKEKNIRTISSMDYSGVLTVNDSAIFEQVLRCGIGRAKAYGCGLLLVRRI